jgi:hypothetical protein
MLSTISSAPLPISSTASYAIDVACFVLKKLHGRPLRTRFGDHRRAVIGNDANQPVARHFNTGSNMIWKFEPLVSFLQATIVAKDFEMRLISKLGIANPYGNRTATIAFLERLSYEAMLETM